MHSADAGRLEEHLLHVADVVQSVRQRVPDARAFTELQEDPFALDGLVYRLQTAVQSMIDVAFQLSAKEFRRAPENSAQAFEILESEGIITREHLARIRQMVRFRNLIVHGYLRRDDAIIGEIAVQRLTDFSAFVQAVRRYLKANSAPTDKSEG